MFKEMEKNKKDRGDRHVSALNDYFDAVHQAKEKLAPIMSLMSNSVELNPELGNALTNEEISGLGLLLSEILDDVFTATDELYDICKKVKCTRPAA